MHAGSTGESGTSWESFVAKFNKLRSEREQLAKKEPQGKGLPKTPGTILWLAKEAVSEKVQSCTVQGSPASQSLYD